VLYGSGAGETVSGREALRAFAQGFFDQGLTLGWSWDALHCVQDGHVAWFVGPAVLRVEQAGTVREAPYRLSGVLRRADGEWRIAMFNGSEPVED
jgi:ketosteroid isomerase-like protein